MPPFLARSIAAAKWTAREGIGDRHLLAEAVTNDMRIKETRLSFWLCDPSKAETLEDVALVLASTKDNIDRVELVWLPEDHIRQIRLTIDKVDGKTPAKSLNNQHRDIAGIDIWRVICLGRGIIKAVRRNDLRVYSKAEVSKLLLKALDENRIELSGLNEKLRKKVQELIAKNPG